MSKVSSGVAEMTDTAGVSVHMISHPSGVKHVTILMLIKGFSAVREGMIQCVKILPSICLCHIFYYSTKESQMVEPKVRKGGTSQGDMNKLGPLLKQSSTVTIANSEVQHS